MFENVAQLEKEVRDFQENILASKELVRNLEQLVVAAKAQQEQLAKSTDELLRDIPASVEEKNSALRGDVQRIADQMKADSEAAVSKALSEVRDSHQQHIEVLSAIEGEVKKTADKLCTDNHAVMNEAVAKLQQTNQQHIDALTSVESEIKKFEADLTAKYADFVAKLEASNMDKIFTMCEDIKKTVNSKFTILLGGVGLSIILSVIALIIK